MKRTVTVFVLAVVAAFPWIASAQEGYRWTDKQGKTHITAKPPKQEDVTQQEWDRLQKEMEGAKTTAAADSESLPALAPGTFLKWKDKGGAEHYTNAPPKHSDVSDAEWERLKADIPKMNEAATAKAAEAPKPAATPAPEAGGESLPALPAGKTLLWTGKDGKRNMTSDPPRQDQVTDKEWERLKKEIADMIEEAKNAPPPSTTPPPMPPPVDEKKPEGDKPADKPGDAAPPAGAKPADAPAGGEEKSSTP